MTETERPVRILLAEDEPSVRVLLSRQLRKAGYEVTACSNGREALSAITTAGADILLADWMMPEMDGLDLCRAVRELSAADALARVYVIVLSAIADKERVVEALDAGVDDCLTKPYHEDELFARLRAATRIIALQRQITDRQIEIHRINAQMAILNRQLQILATTDDLTKLPNRRFLLERLEHAWSLAQRHARPLSVLMLDIDHFKNFNDTHGHETGDAVLVSVAARIKAQVRGTDVCGRLGGEEFLIVCPETPLDGAVRLAERIRVAVEQHVLRQAARELRVTVSVGVVERQTHQQSGDAMVADADAALYAAKAAGRNRVRVSNLNRIEEPPTDALAVSRTACSPSFQPCPNPS